MWPAALPAEPILGDASVRFEYPEEAGVTGGTGGMGFVSARIARGSEDIDLMLVIDVSASTREIAGDVDGDDAAHPSAAESGISSRRRWNRSARSLRSAIPTARSLLS